MDSAFTLGLRQLKKADPERAIEALFEMFNSIGTMEAHEVVAAKQTLDVFRETSTLDEASLKIVSTMEKALITRARILLIIADQVIMQAGKLLIV